MKSQRIFARYKCLYATGARVALVCCLALAFAGRSHAANFTSFDVPSGSIDNGGPVVINASGVIAGTYDSPLPCPCGHGFVRATNGAITSFDAPNAFYTEVESINDSGAIAGFYKPVNENLNSSFIRSADGLNYIVFDPVSGPNINSYATGINNAGVAVGYYQDYDEALPRHTYSYVRAANGTITIFGVPNILETYAQSINDLGVIGGSYRDANNVWHGFVRAADGTITTFDAKGNATFTVGLSVNLAGGITGDYSEKNDKPLEGHGYLRAADGQIDRFDVLHADQTTPVSMSPSGIIAGWYEDPAGDHGFVREAGKNGKFTTFDVPFGFGTTPTSVNNDGTVAGWYWEPISNTPKGFFGKP